MSEHLRGPGARQRVLIDHFHQQVSASRAKRRGVTRDMVNVAVHVCFQFLLVVPIEEVSACQKIEKDGTERENVAVVGVSHSLEDLWGDVPRGTALLVQKLIIGGLCRET